MLKDDTWPKGGGTIEFRNEVRPADLYCYLAARFGAPNGFQNLFRKDDSDNFIHWEWTLRHAAGIVTIQGMNFRTEVNLHGPVIVDPDDRDRLAVQFKANFPAYGKGMSKVRHHLEDWTEFVNPHQRIRRAVAHLMEEFDELKLVPEVERIDDHWAEVDSDSLQERWQETATRYAKGFSISFAIRSMLPVMAESYVNLVMSILLRAELRNDERLRDNAVRQPIDVRIKLLSVNCEGLIQQPDYTAEPCRRYHSLVNERNDLLHGNVVVEKLRFNDVYFFGRVPIFREYRSMWQRSLDIEMQAVGLLNVREEKNVVESMIAYLESCMHPNVREHVRQAAASYELGWNKQTGRLGVLFPPHLVDMRAGPIRSSGGETI